MESPGVATTSLTCSQCGGELHPDEGQVFLACPYCGATVYVDKSRVVFHWYVAPTLDEPQALAALYRWMSSSQTVKDLDKKARVEGQAFQFFPVWYIKWKDGKGEVETLRPAAATSVTELSGLKLPAGDLKRYDHAIDAQAVPPTIPLDSALAWLRETGSSQTKISAGDRQAVQEAAIVHVPVYSYKYAFGGKTYTAIVDAASGGVLANLFPSKFETPYRIVGGVTALVYLCLALFGLVGMFSGGDTGSVTLLGICVGLGLLAAPILFAWAFWVASKI